MGDPFSVASSAIGVLSLGLTVCQVLVTYCSQVKSFKQETDDVAGKANSLKDVLSALLCLLSDAAAFDPSILDKVKLAVQLIEQCGQSVNRLEKMLEKVRNHPGPSSRKSEKAKEHLDRVLYPFRRDDLMSFGNTIDGLKVNLDLALGLLEIAMQIDSHKRMASMETKANDLAMNATSTLDIVQGLDRKHSHTDDKLDKIDKQIEQMMSIVLHQGAKRPIEPASLNSFIVEHQRIGHDIGNLANQAQRRRRRAQTRCICSNPNFPFCKDQPNLATLSHKEGCPHYILGQKIQVIRSTFTVCSRFLAFSMLTALTITTGAGGFAISPSLKFRAVVRQSPIFDVINIATQRVRKDDFETIISDLRKELLHIFQEGTASPTDTDVRGDTVLHFLAYLYESCCLYNDNIQSSSSFGDLINMLIDRGVLPNCPNGDGWTPAYILATMAHVQNEYISGKLGRDRRSQLRENLLNASFTFVDAGSYLTEKPFAWNETFRTKKQLYMKKTSSLFWNAVERAGVDGIYFPEALDPLITRSTQDLEWLIRKGVDMQSAFHIYTIWPEGLSILLQAGFSAIGDPFDWAVNEGVYESVRLLLSSQNMHLGWHELYAVSRSQNSQIKGLFVNALAQRRTRLQDLAETFLPSNQLEQLQIQPGCLLDGKAEAAYQMLVDRGINMDFDEEFDFLVYGSIAQDLEMANLLWAAGFRDVDNRQSGHPSYALVGSEITTTAQRLLEFTDWLITKGTDVHRTRHPSDILSVLHYVANEVGVQLPHLSKVKRPLSEEAERIKRMIFIDTARGTYDCACSLDGGNAVTSLLRGFFRARGFIYSPFDMLHEYPSYTQPLYKFVTDDLKDCFDTHAEAIIRAFTFQALGIPHMCHFHSSHRDQMDGLECEEETTLLEDLMYEFLPMYEHLGMSLLSFLEDEWLKRMKEVLLIGQPPSDEQINKIRELGVILDDIDLEEVDEELVRVDDEKSLRGKT